MKRTFLILFTLISFFITIPLQGFSQYSDTTITQKDRLKFKTFLPAIIAISYGVVALGDGPLKNLDQDIAERRNDRRPTFHTTADDYLRYAPFVALYGYELLGIKGKHDVKEKTSLVLLTAVVSVGSTKILKNIIDKERPNSYDFKSFPSGHAAIAFTGAELINQEYGDLSPWYSIAGYTVASATSVLRIYSNDHWFSDVVAGAGVGVLSTKLAYVVYPHLKKLLVNKEKDFNFTAVPAYQDGVLGVSISGRF
ncbi:phosphatase PAP2 family protein [Pedobacter immunditicola]|uniref:phosphatase PAP2 family protein n=1 Tax=Pedobacter immunditicola TaxID=3133440 RepID=UPI0030AFCB07